MTGSCACLHACMCMHLYVLSGVAWTSPYACQAQSMCAKRCCKYKNSCLHVQHERVAHAGDASTIAALRERLSGAQNTAQQIVDHHNRTVARLDYNLPFVPVEQASLPLDMHVLCAYYATKLEKAYLPSDMGHDNKQHFNIIVALAPTLTLHHLVLGSLRLIEIALADIVLPRAIVLTCAQVWSISAAASALRSMSQVVRIQQGPACRTMVVSAGYSVQQLLEDIGLTVSLLMHVLDEVNKASERTRYI